MLDFSYRKDVLVVRNDSKKEINFDTNTLEMTLDGFDVSFPWEYEKSGILLEVKEYEETLFYNFLIDSKHVVFVSKDSFELKEDILNFFWDVDILLIKASKDAIKTFENIEAKVIIPYGDEKDIFLNSLWKHLEAVKNYKQKAELPFDTSEFVNLEK